MKKRELHAEFTAAELGYLLFCRKICPSCGGKLKKHRSLTMVCGQTVDPKNQQFHSLRQPVQNWSWFFVCERCRAKWTLTELSEQ